MSILLLQVQKAIAKTSQSEKAKRNLGYPKTGAGRNNYGQGISLRP